MANRLKKQRHTICRINKERGRGTLRKNWVKRYKNSDLFWGVPVASGEIVILSWIILEGSLRAKCIVELAVRKADWLNREKFGEIRRIRKKANRKRRSIHREMGGNVGRITQKHERQRKRKLYISIDFLRGLHRRGWWAYRRRCRCRRCCRTGGVIGQYEPISKIYGFGDKNILQVEKELCIINLYRKTELLIRKKLSKLL